MRIFLKQYMQHLIDASRTNLSTIEKLDLKICNQGADRAFMHLFNFVVRNGWEDHKGYPIKKLFYDKGLLACCISIRTLMKRTGFSSEKTQNLLTKMEELGWFYREKTYTNRGQIVYVLGKWVYGKDKDGEEVKLETLFRDEARNNYIKEKVDKPKENDYSEYSFNNIYR